MDEALFAKAKHNRFVNINYYFSFIKEIKQVAINKIINESTMSHEKLKERIESIFEFEEVKNGYVDITGPYLFDEINRNNVYRAFIDEKELWNKDKGRMYMYSTISFVPEEKISLEEALEFGLEFANRYFNEYQSLIAVHEDEEHISIHLITNTVSYIDGLKLHTSQSDLQEMKDLTNEMCKEKGLIILSRAGKPITLVVR